MQNTYSDQNELYRISLLSKLWYFFVNISNEHFSQLVHFPQKKMQFQITSKFSPIDVNCWCLLECDLIFWNNCRAVEGWQGQRCKASGHPGKILNSNYLILNSIYLFKISYILFQNICDLGKIFDSRYQRHSK